MGVKRPSTGLLKLAALCWLRYGKRLPFVCTEAGRWNGDVIGASSTTMIEVEVKTTIADVRAEFRNKRSKHYVYDKATERSRSVPNFFYFLVPQELADRTKSLVEDQAPKAGVLAYDPQVDPTVRGAVSVVKRPIRLYSSQPHPDTLETIARRCSSELCGLHRAVIGLKADILDRIDSGMDSIVKMAVDDVGTLDFEESP